MNAETIPRLELMAARTLAQLMDTVRNALAGEVEIDQVKYFSDSKAVLCWIANRNEWKVFVKHRVNEILKWSKKEDWGYCPSAENPADVGSRGVGAHGLTETELWWNGPRWLRTPGEGFPTPLVEIETEESSLEMKKSCVLKVTIQETAKNVECIMEIEKSCVLKVTIQETAKNVECIMEIEKSCVLKVTIQETAKNVECIMEIEKSCVLKVTIQETAKNVECIMEIEKSCVLKVTIQETAKNVECIMEIEKSCVLKVTIQETAKNVECIMEIEKSCVLKVTIQETAKNVECIMEIEKSCVLKVTIQETAKNVECIMEIEKSCVLKVTIQETAKNVECIMEIEKSCVLKVTIQETAKNVECIMEIEKFSSLNRLYRVTAYVRRFIHNLRAKQKGVLRKNGELSRGEIIGAERVWILAAQAKLKNQDNYADLVKELRIVEYNGLLKCRGRLNNSDLSLEGKQPIILPRDHCLTKLIINECHNRVFHSGLRSTLAELRSRFWVPRGRQKVKNIIKDCWVCRKIQGQSFSP